MQKHVNLVDLVKGLPTNIHLQNLASIQLITSLTKFDHLAEKSEQNQIKVRHRSFQLRYLSPSCGLFPALDVSPWPLDFGDLLHVGTVMEALGEDGKTSPIRAVLEDAQEMLDGVRAVSDAHLRELQLN